MQIIKSEIYKARPRVYKEKATLQLEDGDVIIPCRHNWRKIEISEGKHMGPQIVDAKRFVKKNGAPLSDWIFIIGYYSYMIKR